MNIESYHIHPYINSNCNLILDANLLTVLIIAKLGDGEVERYKRTRAFTTQDAKLLQQLIGHTKNVIVTPHILTETCNLLDWLSSDKRKVALKKLADFVNTSEEIYQPANEVMDEPSYIEMGLSDAVLYRLSHQPNYVLISDDFKLCQSAEFTNDKAINFNHLKFFL